MTQIQLIQSLGEAMNWLEKELNWGNSLGELRHLTGRIGELYVALIKNGQMAFNVNEKGYDVISSQGRKISVKTTSMTNTSGHISFNSNTLHLIDDVVILQINAEEMQIEILLDDTIENTKLLINEKGQIPLSKLLPKNSKVIELKLDKIKEVNYDNYLITELENGTIKIKENGKDIDKTMPILIKIAKKMNLSILNSNGNKYNTRQLGSNIIKILEGR